MKKLDFDFHFLAFIRMIWLYIRYASFRPLVNDAIKLFGSMTRLPSDPAATKPAPAPVSTPPPVVHRGVVPLGFPIAASPQQTMFYENRPPPPADHRPTPAEIGVMPTAAGAEVITAQAVERSVRKKKVRRLLTTLPTFKDLENHCPGCKRRLIARGDGELYCLHCKDSYPS